MSYVQFPSLIAKATYKESSRYALGNVFVSPEGDAIATDGRILACVQARHYEGEQVDEKGWKTDIPATESVYVPGKLGPSKAGDVGATFSINGDATKQDRKGAKTTVAIEGGRFPRVYDELPVLGDDCREFTIRPKQLVALMDALNSPGEEYSDMITLILPSNPNKAIGVVSNTFGETRGIGVLTPIKESNTAREQYARRREQLSRLNKALSDFNAAL